MDEKEGTLTGNFLQDLDLLIAAVKVIGEFALKYGFLDEFLEDAEGE